MALLTANNLATLDYSLLGEPFVKINAQDTIDLDTLDYSLLGGPFWGHELSVGSAFSVQITDSIKLADLTQAQTAATLSNTFQDKILLNETLQVVTFTNRESIEYLLIRDLLSSGRTAYLTNTVVLTDLPVSILFRIKPLPRTADIEEPNAITADIEEKR